MAQDVLRAHVHAKDMPSGSVATSRAELLTAVLAHDRALRALLGSRRAPPVEAVRESWLPLLCAVLHRLPDEPTASDPIHGLTLHMEALRASGVPTEKIVAAVSRLRMGRT